MTDASPPLLEVASDWPLRPRSADSRRTVMVALSANVAVALAKTLAAAVTHSPSILAEAAHSWADTGNEAFLAVANGRAVRPPDGAHPLGHGREAYVWSMLAAVGLFVAGGVLSLVRGVNELRAPTGAQDFLVGYLVLGVSFLLEGASLLQTTRQGREEAQALGRKLLQHVKATSDPTLRAVFAEDVVALVGLLVATAGLVAHQVTGSATPDAVGSILIGVLLAAVAIRLTDSNRRFIVGEEADPALRMAALRALLSLPEVARVTYLRLEVVGPRSFVITGRVDLAGDEVESRVAKRLRAIEDKLRASPTISGALLSLSPPDDPSLQLEKPGIATGAECLLDRK